MPLVERYNDWTIDDGSYDDPHTLAFDHRFEATEATFQKMKAEAGLAEVEINSQATCLITELDPDYGWIDAGDGEWIYDPDARPSQLRPTLATQFHRDFGPCVEHDRNSLLAALRNVSDKPDVSIDSSFQESLSTLSWPTHGDHSRDTTSHLSRFPLSSEYVAGPVWSSGYHLGNGIVGTAGHCLIMPLLRNDLEGLKVVFGWVGDVRRKRFPASQIFGIEKVMLCDVPGEYQDPGNIDGVASWARRWDDALFKLKGNHAQFDSLGKVEIATRPPNFGSPVYNCGHPLGTPQKISPKSHVLRHALFKNNTSPFYHAIDPQGSYTTDLDQFPGNSGGPVIDGSTGEVVGHTVSTQSAVAEATMTDIENWEAEFIFKSENFRAANRTINPYLALIKPDDPSFRVHPKFMRTLSGHPCGGALLLNTTFICPGDIGPNKISQPANTYQAVFNRHQWASPDVVFRNLTGRTDRIHLFTLSLELIVREFPGSTLIISIAGRKDTLKEPAAGANILITAGIKSWKIALKHQANRVDQVTDSVKYQYTLDLLEATGRSSIPRGFKSSHCFADWTSLQLEQSNDNPPDLIGLELTVRRPSFPFPVNQTWPENRPDVTNDPEDHNLEWPAESFRFSTAVGANAGATQGDEPHSKAPRTGSDGRTFLWTAPIDRVWTNPAQPTSGFQAVPGAALLDPLLSDGNQRLI